MHFTLFHVMSFVSCHSICCVPFIYFKSFHSCHAVFLVSLMSDIGFIMFHLIHFNSFHSFHAYHFLSFHSIRFTHIISFHSISSHLSYLGHLLDVISSQSVISFHPVLFRFTPISCRFVLFPFMSIRVFRLFHIFLSRFIPSVVPFVSFACSVSFGSFITFIHTLILSVNLVCFHVVSSAPQGQFSCCTSPQLWATRGHWLPSFEISPSAGSDTSASQHCHGMVPTSEAKWNKSITWCQ